VTVDKVIMEEVDGRCDEKSTTHHHSIRRENTAAPGVTGHGACVYRAASQRGSADDGRKSERSLNNVPWRRARVREQRRWNRDIFGCRDGTDYG
jgi:hypothetical protein